MLVFHLTFWSRSLLKSFPAYNQPLPKLRSFSLRDCMWLAKISGKVKLYLHWFRLNTQVHGYMVLWELKACAFSCPVMSESLWPHGLQAPLSTDSLGKNTGVGNHSYSRGSFLPQGSNLGLLSPLHWQVDSSQVSHEESAWAHRGDYKRRQEAPPFPDVTCTEVCIKS